MRALIVALKLKLSRDKPAEPSHDPETAAIHARLDASTERLDRVLHTLTRRLSSKIDRPHLAIVKKT